MAGAETTMRVGRRQRAADQPDKVLFPDDGITKADLADYYAAVAPAMVPHVRDRPLNLWRWNLGIDKPVVIQQAIPKGAPDWVKRVTVPRRRGGEVAMPSAARRRRSSGWRTRTALPRTRGRAARTGPTIPTGWCSTSTRRTTARASSRRSAQERSRSATCCASAASSRSR